MSNGENLQREISALERALRDASNRAETVQSALDDLEGHRKELAGRLALARQAAADYAARLDERRQELERALEAEVQARLTDAVRMRDGAAGRAAEAMQQVIAAFERLDAVRDELATRVAETESQLGRRAEVPPESEDLEREWARLVEFVRARAQLRLDDEIVEAAASSPLGFDIDKLPEHLRVVARQRRRERMQSDSRRQPSG